LFPHGYTVLSDDIIQELFGSLKRNPTIQSIVRLTRRYASLNLAFFIVLILLRCYEFIAIGAIHELPEHSFRLFLLSLGSDFIVLLVLSGFLFLPYLALSFLKPRAGLIFHGSVLLLFAIADVALLQYFAVTFTPLGADLFGYSWHDIQLTVRSSGGFSLLSILPFGLVVLLTIAALMFSGRIKLPGYIIGGYFVLILPACAFTSSFTPAPGNFRLESEYNLVMNKVGYFVARVVPFLTHSQDDEAGLPAQEYPLMHDVSYDDVLGPFFNTGPKKPNLVFIIVEGLGRSFVGEGAPLGGFTPFLDSLTGRSLYWENFLSTSGRTFSVLPSLFGSLPFGDKGFMEMGDRMPAHLSLIRLLQQQGYFTSYYYGSTANFDFQDVFLERQHLDLLVDEYQFGTHYKKSEADAKGFSWGYADGDLFKRSMEVIEERNKDPRLDIYLTISTHEPFLPPNKEHYLKEFNDRVGKLTTDERKLDTYRKYQPEFSSLLYMDDALRYLMSQYERRADFDHTIFIITGDHRVIPIPTENAIDRFHVPMIMFSKMLKHPQRFSSVSTHADVTPSILAFLEANYGMPAPKRAHWLGAGIDTSRGFRNIHTMPLMRTKEELIDFLDNDYFLSGDQLFRLRDRLELEKSSDDTVKSSLVHKFNTFRQINRYVCANDKLYPEPTERARLAALAADDSAFAIINALNLNSDQLFQLAREKASAEKYEEARTICRKLLRNGPNFHDVRTLLGRTYAWDKRYDESRTVLEEVIRRAPNYPDAQLALIDVEIWSSNAVRALELTDAALLKFPSNPDFLVRKVKILIRNGKKQDALRALDQLVKLNPSSADAPALRKQIAE
jgi:lipoteichoic acid synthase